MLIAYFAEIDEALQQQVQESGNKQTVRLNTPENMLDKQKGLALLGLVAPVAGAVAALGLAGRKDSGEDQK